MANNATNSINNDVCRTCIYKNTCAMCIHNYLGKTQENQSKTKSEEKPDDKLRKDKIIKHKHRLQTSKQ